MLSIDRRRVSFKAITSIKVRRSISCQHVAGISVWTLVYRKWSACAYSAWGRSQHLDKYPQEYPEQSYMKEGEYTCNKLRLQFCSR